MKKNWQNDIHDRMSDYEIQEPKGLWEDVSKKMAEMKGECQEDMAHSHKGGCGSKHCATTGICRIKYHRQQREQHSKICGSAYKQTNNSSC